MKKFLLICTLVASLLCLSALAADDALVRDASYVVSSGNSFEVSFSVETEKENAWAVISAHGADGRLVGVKLVQLTSETVSEKLGNIDEISYARIIIVEAKDNLKPLCADTVVDNYSKTGDTYISVDNLFPAE